MAGRGCPFVTKGQTSQVTKGPFVLGPSWRTLSHLHAVTSYDRNYDYYEQMKGTQSRGGGHFIFLILYGTTEEMTKRFSVDLYEKKEGCVDYGERYEEMMGRWYA